MNACDCYVSLHRSEGFGLTIAEAMALGKPVIATGYSGNMDFMNKDNSFPVDYRLVGVDGDYGAYKKGNVWAEPDIDEAADYMRRVFDNGSQAETVGKRAGEFIKKYYNIDKIGVEYKKRLNKIYYKIDISHSFENIKNIKKIIFIWNPVSINVFGGGEKVLHIVLSNLLASGYDFRVVAIVHDKKEIENEHAWAEPYRSYKDKMYFYLSSENNFQNQLVEFHREFNPDISVVAHPFIISPVFESLRAAGDMTKIVYWDHGSLSDIFFSESKNVNSATDGQHKTLIEFTEKSLKLCDGFLAISTGIRNKIKSIVPDAKIYTVFNPVKAYGGSLNQRPATPLFIYVGRLDNKQKNISFMFYGLNAVKNLRWRLKIIGDGQDGYMLKILSQRLGIDDRIEWTGFKDCPYNDLVEVTALLLTSRFEGLPLCLIEANQRGIPVISSDCRTGPEDIVIPGKNGYLYEEGNMDNFINVIKGVINGELSFDTPENISITAEKFKEDEYMEAFIKALNDIKRYI